jgi:hypothetical protein
MCYPYGVYNIDTIQLLKNYNCECALTTKVAIANTSNDSKFELSRLDTIDIPKDASAEVNKWFLKG